jgi:hypothetical protein
VFTSSQDQEVVGCPSDTAGKQTRLLDVYDSKLLGHDLWLDVVVSADLYIRLICTIPMIVHRVAVIHHDHTTSVVPST